LKNVPFNVDLTNDLELRQMQSST